MKSRVLWVAIAGAVLVGTIAAGTVGNAWAGSERAVTEPRVSEQAKSSDGAPVAIDHNEALRRDAAAYADVYGVSIDEAVRRLALQTEIGPTNAALEAALPDRLAGVWLEHTGTFRLVAWYTGDTHGLEAAVAIAEQAPLPVEIRTGASNTMAHLTGVASEIGHRFTVDDRVAGTYVDATQGTVHVDLQSDSPLGPDAPQLEVALRSEFGLPVVVTILDGVLDDDAAYGGGVYSSCTTGFSVENANEAVGISTAGHCSNSGTYWDGGTGYGTTFVAEVRSAYADFQWSSVATTTYPMFWNGYTFVNVNGQLTRSQQALQSIYCHYGKTTGYSCSYLISKTYQPTYSGACNGVTCASTWMLAHGYTYEGADGDSGGPWFTGGTALGIHKASLSSSLYGLYMAIDYIGGVGVHVLLP